MTIINDRVCGIPCKIEVTHYRAGSMSRNAPSDVDYYGECEYIILDSRGRYAEWLERKMSDRDHDEVCDTIHEHMRKEAKRDRDDWYASRCD